MRVLAAGLANGLVRFASRQEPEAEPRRRLIGRQALLRRVRLSHPRAGTGRPPCGFARRLGMLWPATAVVALLTWPAGPILPTAAIDPSWHLGLHLAAEQRLVFGTDVVFTYGPLGFLSVPVVVTSWTTALAAVYIGGMQVALCGTLLAAIRRYLALPAAALLTYLVASLPVARSDLMALVAFAWLVFVLERRPEVDSRAIVLAAGALAALALLVKLSAGLLALPLLGLMAWWLPPHRERAVLLFGASFTVTLLSLWILTGGGVVDLGRWLILAPDVVGGYTAAMALSTPGREWEYLAAGLLLASLGSLVWKQTESLSRRRRTVLLASVAVVAFAYFKHGFVRHDMHSIVFFSAVALMLLPFSWLPQLRRRALAAACVPLTIVLVNPDVPIRETVLPFNSIRAVARLGWLLPSGERTAVRLEHRRAELRTELALSPQIVRALAGRETHVDPYDVVAAWAAGARWRPLPVFQSYAAWTAKLDSLNAEALQGADAPERILRRDRRRLNDTTQEVEAPATFLGLLCYYREVITQDAWQVLARTRPRCGPERPIGTARASAGQLVRVPGAAAGELVLARFSLPRSTADALWSVLWKPVTPSEIVLNDVRRARLLEATAGQPHVLRVPPTAGFSPHFGGDLSHVSFRLEGARGEYSVEFLAVPLLGPAGEEPGTFGLSERGGRPVLVLPGGELPIVADAVQGRVEHFSLDAARIRLGGWAGDPRRGVPADLIVLVSQETVLHAARPAGERPNAVTGSARPPRGAFDVEVPLEPEQTLRSLRAFAVVDSVASELSLPRIQAPR